MIRNVAIELLNLIKNNSGIDKKDLYTNPNLDIQKIIDIILSETRCSVTDCQGNYSRFGSSTDIRIIRNLINIFISNTNEIPPEIVCMALRKEETFGPFLKINFEKKYEQQNKIYELEMEKIFPNDFYTSIFEENIEVRNAFIEKILKPYVKEVIFENDVLMSKSPLGAFISKLITTPKTKEMVNILTDLKLNDVNTLIIVKELDENSKAIEYISITILSNILGLGVASTSTGLKAFEYLKEEAKDSKLPSKAMITFIILNITSFTIFPTTIISIRNNFGATNDMDVLLIIMVVTFIGTLVGIILDKIFNKVMNR